MSYSSIILKTNQLVRESFVRQGLHTTADQPDGVSLKEQGRVVVRICLWSRTGLADECAGECVKTVFPATSNVHQNGDNSSAKLVVE